MDRQDSEHTLSQRSEWFIIFLSVGALYVFFTYSSFRVEDSYPYVVPIKSYAKEKARAERLLAKHLAVPGVRASLSGRPVNISITPDDFVVGNAAILANPYGGYYTIYFLADFIEKLNDAQLSAVLGHELGHAILDHTADKYSEIRKMRVPRFEEIYSDCFSIFFTGEDATKSMLLMIFGERNPYINMYVARIQSICEADHIYDAVLSKAPKTP